jgi:beta-glucuronidase
MSRLTFRQTLLAMLLPAVVSGAVSASQRERIDLSGTWLFAADYPRVGERSGWQNPGLDNETWDPVEVPHIWNLEPRFEFTGAGWYRRTFRAPELRENQQARLTFGAVFYASKVWLNGKLLGEHEGGYTAFEFDATAALKPGAENTLAVMVDNSWNTETLPGSRVGSARPILTYAWWNYGGIKQPVFLEISAPVYIPNQKIAATPDLAAGTATVSVKVSVRNTLGVPERKHLRVRLRRPGAWDVVAAAETNVNIGARSVAVAELVLPLAAGKVALWDVDHPSLYESLAELTDGGETVSDSHLARFGIRKLEIRNARLLLNGEPVSFGGANRSADHPKYGSMENHEVIDKDLSMMKMANMGLARMLHYPCSPTLLDWADEHGFLIIEEAGNWGLPVEQLESEVIRGKWKQQAREMIEQGWNHPSVIAWSVGNEYASDTSAGVRWTRDMIEFVRRLDDSRFTTFVSLGAKAFSKVKPEENSFHYADILCANIYGNSGLAKSMEALHAAWPEKPVLISEFGFRTDASPSEEWRVRQFREAVAILRKYPFVIGASVWAWNDYKSRLFGTNPDGYRHWGLVTADRKPLDSYYALREEFSPVVIAGVELDRKPQGLMKSATVRVKLEGRPDFPARVLRDHKVVLSLVRQDGSILKSIPCPLPVLKPGEKVQIEVPVRPFDLSAVPDIKVEIEQPTGFISVEKTVSVSSLDVK